MFNFLAPKKYSTIAPREFAHVHRKQEKKVAFVDVREKEEWDEGHIDLFQHIPLGTLDDHVDELKQCERVYFLCRSGERSGKACARLVENGYDNAVRISGGIVAWGEEGFPIKK